MNSAVVTPKSDPRPKLYILSSRGRSLVDAFQGRLADWYSGQTLAAQIEELSTPVDGPMTPCVVVVDCRSESNGQFDESDLLNIGHIQARLPQAIPVLLTPALNARLRRLIQRASVRHLYDEPIDWKVLGGHLREIARRLTERDGGPQGQMTGLMEICLAMGSTLELAPLLDKILDLMISDLMAHQGSILLLDRETDRLQMLASRGLPGEITRKGYIPRKGSIAEWVIENDQPLLLHDQVRDSRFSPLSDRRTIASSMCIPLRARGAVQGTINLNRVAPASRFRDEDLRTATILAAQAAISIENARLYEANLQAERLSTIGQTVAAVSHGMKSIVTCLRGGISICDQAHETRDWELMDKGWGLVKRNFQRLSAMALEMLDYSKSGREPIRVEFPLPPLIQEVLATVGARAAALNIRLSHSLADPSQTLCADREQIFRAVLNLTENALDAVERDGTVHIFVRQAAPGSGQPIPIALGKAPSAVFIEITDSGPGISPEDQKRIFTPFFSTKGSKGTGLGLAVTHKTVLEHGGKILIESQLGQGAKFIVVLPNGNPAA